MIDHPSALVSVPRDDDQRPFSDSLLPEAMIYAGSDALDRAQMDMANYVSGETIDWDQGMIAVAVYRAMLAAALATREEAPAEAGEVECDGCDGDRCVYVGSLCNPSAQPQAREDAQPVQCHHEAYQGRCVHCGVKIVNGFAVTSGAGARFRQTLAANQSERKHSQCHKSTCAAAEAWSELANRRGWEISYSGLDEERRWVVHRPSDELGDCDLYEVSRAETPLEATLAALQAEQGAK